MIASQSGNEKSKSYDEYNEVISHVAKDYSTSFAAIASPTISRQEAVTDLFHKCIEPNNNKIDFVPFLVLPFRLIWHFMNMVLLSIIFRAPEIKPNSIYIRSWLVPQSFIDGNIRDEYFRNMPDDLRKTSSVIQAFQPLGYRYSWRLLKCKLKNDQVLPLGLLSIIDIIKLFYEFLSSGFLKIEGNYMLGKKNIVGDINNSLRRDFIEMRSFLAFQEKYIAQKLIKLKISKFIYVFENQSWEKVYCNIFAKNNITTIGYQSSGFSKKFLNFYPTKIDKENQNQPNFILTVGDAFTKLLKEEAYYRSSILTYAAMRFDHPSKDNKYIISNQIDYHSRKLLYAFSVDISQYDLIINELKKVFGGTDFIIHLKFHPLHEIYAKNFKSELPANFFIVTQTNNDNLSREYDFILFNDNSYGLESLIFGVKSIEIDFFGNNFDERLIYFHEWDHRIKVFDIESLAIGILNGTVSKFFNQDNIENYINFLYTPYIGNAGKFLELNEY